jgi:hypothetical protein
MSSLLGAKVVQRNCVSNVQPSTKERNIYRVSPSVLSHVRIASWVVPRVVMMALGSGPLTGGNDMGIL